MKTGKSEEPKSEALSTLEASEGVSSNAAVELSIRASLGEIDAAIVEYQPCPRCGSDRGRLCVTISNNGRNRYPLGTPTRIAHSARMRSWARAGRPGVRD